MDCSPCEDTVPLDISGYQIKLHLILSDQTQSLGSPASVREKEVFRGSGVSILAFFWHYRTA